MKNLEQIRARNAWATAQGKGKIAGKQDGEVIKKIPPTIKNHGLLAAAGYACDEKNNGWREAFGAITEHLACPEIALIKADAKTVHDLIAYLTSPEANSETLKLATAETLAWLNYARRFISKKGSRNHGE